MKSLPLIRSLMVAGLAAVGFSSCVGVDPGYGGSYYDGGYGYPYNSYGGGYLHSGGGYYGHNHHDHDDHDHGHNHNHSSHDDDKIKLIRGSDGKHGTRPQGNHSAEWYKNRGYDLSKYTHKHKESGEVHKGSKSSSSHKSDNHKDDDNHKGHKH